MTTSITITIALLILISYAFDLSAKKTRIPTVVLLLALGCGVQQLVHFLPWIHIPDLKPLLPVFGEIGLLLIVLEGALELEINREKKTVLRKASFSALIPIILLGGFIAGFFQYQTGAPFATCMVNALPFCVISSALAIPTAHHLPAAKKEFIIYESSLSDIFGVILFNFFLAKEAISAVSILHFLYQMLIMIVISFVASVGLAYFIKKVEHRVKFIPIILIVFVIYTLSKEFQLPSLLFILIFGILLNNLDELKKFRFIRNLEPERLESEVGRFGEIVGELSFLMRSVFFLLFGFIMNIRDLLEPWDILITLGIVFLVFIIRYFQLRIGRLGTKSLLYIAPRGLISLLLYLSIPQRLRLTIVNEPLMIQVVLLSSVVMMLGSIFTKEHHEEEIVA